MNKAAYLTAVITSLTIPLVSGAYDEFWIEPKAGTPGSTVSIFGNGFNESKGKALISSPDLKKGKKFKCKIISWNDEQIIIQVPATVKKQDSNYDIEVLDKGNQSLSKFESLFAISEPKIDAGTVYFREIAKGKKTYACISFNGSCLGTKKGKAHILDSDSKKIPCQIFRWGEGFVECRLPANFQPGNYTFVFENTSGKTQAQFTYDDDELEQEDQEQVGTVDYRWKSDNRCYLTPRSLNYLGKSYLFYESGWDYDEKEWGGINNTIEVNKPWFILLGGSVKAHWCVPFLANQGADSTAMMVASTDYYGGAGTWGLYMHNPGEELEGNHWTKICDLANFAPWRQSKRAHWGLHAIYDETKKRIHIIYQDWTTHATEFRVRSATINFNLPSDQFVKWDEEEIIVPLLINNELAACAALLPKNDDENIPAAALAWSVPNTGNTQTAFAFFNFETMSLSQIKMAPVTTRNHGCFLANTFDGRFCLLVRCATSDSSDTGYAFYDLTKQEWTKEQLLRMSADSTSTSCTPSMAIRYVVGKDAEGKNTISLVPWFFYITRLTVFKPYCTIFGIDPIGSAGTFKLDYSEAPEAWSSMDDDFKRKACPLIGVIDGAPPTANTDSEDKNSYFSFTKSEQETESYKFSCKVGAFTTIGNKNFGPYFELKSGWSHLHSDTKTYSVTYGMKALASKIYQDKVFLVYLCPITICDMMEFENQQGSKIIFPYLRFSDTSSPSVSYVETDRWWSIEQGIERIWNKPETYTSSWEYDGSTTVEPEIHAISPVNHTGKSVEVGHTYSTTSEDGFYLGAKLQGSVKDIFSAGVEGELNFTWSYSDSKTDKLLVNAQLPDGEISSFNMNVSWFEYADKKGIDNFWCPPDVRTGNQFYNRPWFITYTTSNIKKVDKFKHGGEK